MVILYSGKPGRCRLYFLLPQNLHVKGPSTAHQDVIIVSNSLIDSDHAEILESGKQRHTGTKTMDNTGKGIPLFQFINSKTLGKQSLNMGDT